VGWITILLYLESRPGRFGKEISPLEILGIELRLLGCAASSVLAVRSELSRLQNTKLLDEKCTHTHTHTYIYIYISSRKCEIIIHIRDRRRWKEPGNKRAKVVHIAQDWVQWTR
jgi:hypothetical protein